MDQDGVVVNASDFHSSNPRSFSGRRKHNLLFNVDAVNLLLENNEVEGGGEKGGAGERQNVLFLCSLESSNYWWVVWGRKSYLGSAEISSFVYLV